MIRWIFACLIAVALASSNIATGNGLYLVIALAWIALCAIYSTM